MNVGELKKMLEPFYDNKEIIFKRISVDTDEHEEDYQQLGDEKFMASAELSDEFWQMLRSCLNAWRRKQMRIIKVVRIFNATVSTLTYPVLVIMSRLIQDKSKLEIISGLWVGMGLMALINWLLVLGFDFIERIKCYYEKRY